ncbi:MAG: MBL fold metallo-hydrolase [Lentimicrobiaceae bacterium]|nr:MBL fold metallo-hydrolase [Lentimicrobiaceae bacterium]MCO5264783.1 MBL fold metallo-hydrolase [Lentimicrobium sp.]HPG32272.1 MBL fold metallo-hydrolase [Lentimicrobium sp.]
MINIKILVFNSFSVNCFILSDDSNECVIIDPGCHSETEKEKLATFIESQKLKPVALINTHFHIDHILGNHFVSNRYGLKPTGHVKSSIFWETAKEYGSIFNLAVDEVEKTGIFVEDGDIIRFGHSALEVRYTPGHADGSICLVNHAQKFVIAGDVLFYGSIGRTDLPSGDFDMLMKSIEEKLFTLDDNYTVYPGHGPSTTIGFEKRSNPFIQ